jgi:structural maintenance of chromosome 3 (chondroitin sulfate proteoglycan 6)
MYRRGFACRQLEQIEQKIAEKEVSLEVLIPEWEEQKTRESTERQRLDEASVKLNLLFGKQGWASKFSVSAYRASQESALEASMRS